MYHKIKLFDCGFSLPLIKFRLSDGQERLAIIDTGAEYTMLNKDVQSNASKCKKVQLSGVSGTISDEVKQFTEFVSLRDENNNDIEIPFVGIKCTLAFVNDSIKERVKDNINIDMIVGMNVLAKQQAKIDLKNGYMLIQDK